MLKVCAFYLQATLITVLGIMAMALEIFGWTMCIARDQKVLSVLATRTVLDVIIVDIMKMLGSDALVRAYSHKQ